MNAAISVCIATRNRRDDLARTLHELMRLDPGPSEMIVLADGCTDGTAEFVAQKFPAVRLFAHTEAHGSIPSRNKMATACRSEIMLSLDDDSYPVEADFIARVVVFFAENPALAILSFPQRTDEFPETLTKTDFGPSRFVGTYSNSGAAIRRAVFSALGGYPDYFGHAYEEPDFALRCAAAGWHVREETSLTIRHHYTSAERNELHVHHRHARNELWSVLLRCPAPYALAVALFRVLRQAGYARRRGLSWLIGEPLWWRDCLRGMRRPLAERRPIPWRKYRAWMELVRHPIYTEDEWVAKFGRPLR
jgi:GT2 family glycosyltransferase